MLSQAIDQENHGAQRVFCLKWFDENLILSAGWDNKITIWDIRTNIPIREMFGPHVCGDAVDVRENYVISASYHIKDQVQVWALDSGRNIFTVTLDSRGRKCMPYAIQFCKPGGTQFAVGGNGSSEIYVYNAATMELITTLTDMHKTVYSMHGGINNKFAIAMGNSTKIYLTT